jgi:anti-sigma B factor antagonist
MSFTIQHRKAGSVEILQASGRLVLGDGTSGLRAAVRTVIDNKADLLVDLSGVSYMDSAGLGELVASYASMTSRDREMKLLRPTDKVSSLLHITKLYSTFEVFEDEATALKSFKNVRWENL